MVYSQFSVTVCTGLCSRRNTKPEQPGQNVIFAGTEGSGVFRSTNKGASWTQINSGLTHIVVNAFAVLPPPGGKGDTVIFAGTQGGISRSTNLGSTWTSVDTALTKRIVFSLLAFGNTIVAGTDAGVFLSTDRGTTWAEANTGMTASEIQCLTPGLLTLYAGTHNGGIFQSSLNLESWKRINVGMSVRDDPISSVLPLYTSGPMRLFAGSLGIHGVYLSTDNGTHWTPRDSGLTNSAVRCLDLRSLSNGVHLFAGTQGGGVYLSRDEGRYWTSVSTGLANKNVWALTVAPSGAGEDTSTLFAGTYGSGVFRSTNNGSSWSPVDSGLEIPTVFAFVFQGTALFAGTNGGVFRSTNQGTLWIRADSGITFKSIKCLAVSKSLLFAGTDRGVFMSSDSGRFWTSISSGLPDSGVVSLAVDKTNLYAGTWLGGVFRRSLSGFVSSAPGYVRSTPCRFSLEQNYPNPFNPSTTIRYGLPGRSPVDLAVFNTLGQLVAQLVNEEVNAGYHEVKFEASNQSSGVYFYRLQAGTYVDTKKLLLVR
jgi:hypothetical protein